MSCQLLLLSHASALPLGARHSSDFGLCLSSLLDALGTLAFQILKGTHLPCSPYLLLLCPHSWDWCPKPPLLPVCSSSPSPGRLSLCAPHPLLHPSFSCSISASFLGCLKCPRPLLVLTPSSLGPSSGAVLLVRAELPVALASRVPTAGLPLL